jgi:PIN domain nuclease of toxin-antitoxin system
LIRWRILPAFFDAEAAALAAMSRILTKSIGTSLGDRACLAIAEQVAQSQVTLTVFTAEQAWAKLKRPFKVMVIR